MSIVHKSVSSFALVAIPISVYQVKDTPKPKVKRKTKGA